MDFLKNIARGVYNTGKKVGSAIGGAAGTAWDLLKQNTGNFGNNLASVGSINLSPLQAKIQSEQISSGYGPENYGKTYGPGITMTAAPGPQMTQISNAQKANWMLQNPTGTIVSQENFDKGLTGAYTPITSAPQKTNPYEIPTYRSALPGLTYGGKDTRVSTADQGIPFYNEAGQLITPKTGFGGLGGGGGAFSSYLAASGAQGLAGSGRSAYTGLLGAVGGGGSSPSVTGSAEEEEKPKKRSIGASGSWEVGTTGPQTPVPPVNMTTTGSGAPVFTTSNPDGSKTNVATGERFVAPSEQLSTAVPDTFNLASMEDVQATLSKLINSPENFNSDDVAMLNANLDKAYQVARRTIDAQYQVPENLVVETPEQLQFAEMSVDPFGARQAMDEYRMYNTQLRDFQMQRVNVLKDIQAEKEVYRGVIDDIKANPNLPKGLKLRRLKVVEDRQKEQLDKLFNQADILNEMIDNENEAVNRAFNIVKYAEDKNESKRSSDLQRFKIYVDAGLLGNLTDADVKRYAAALGQPESVIKAARAKAQDPEKDIITSTSDDGTLMGVDKNTGKTVWKIPGGGKTSAAITGMDARQTQNFLNVSTNYQKDPVIASGSKAIDATKIADQVLKNPSSAGNQLSILYTLVKSLDPESAVREGEIDLAQRTQSYLGQFKTSLERISKGKVIADDAAKELAFATKNLAQIWSEAAIRRERTYRSQANVAGIGSAFDEYLAGTKPPSQPSNSTGNNAGNRPPIESFEK